MKVQKYMSFLLTLLLLIGLVSGCSTASKNAASDNFYVQESAGSGIYDGVNEKVEASSTADANLTDRKLVKTLEMNAETEDLDALLEAVMARVDQLGGYVENQRVYNGSNYSSRRSRSASMTIRIPA